MSAFVVDRNVIRYLVEAALASAELSGAEPFYVFQGGKHWRIVPDEQFAGSTREISAAQAGQRLWDENIRSVCYRYPDCGTEGGYIPDRLPGTVGETYQYARHERTYGFPFPPGVVFRAIDFLDYQSCEHPEWETSWAYAFLDALRKTYCRLVPGWREAKWGAPEMPAPAVQGRSTK